MTDLGSLFVVVVVVVVVVFVFHHYIGRYIICSKYTSNSAVPAMVNCPLTVGKSFSDAYHSIYVRTLCVSDASLSHPYIDVVIRRTPFPAGAAPLETAVCTDAVAGAVNCQGKFSTCSTMCNKKFTITTEKQGAGDACSHATGDLDSCVGGDCVVKPSNPDPGQTKDECFTDCDDDVVGPAGSGAQSGNGAGGTTDDSDDSTTPDGSKNTTEGTKVPKGSGGGEAGLIVGLTFLFLLLALVVVLVLFVKRKNDKKEPLPSWLVWTSGFGKSGRRGHGRGHGGGKHASVLPPGWSKHHDSETGKDYFVNETAEVSTFQRPGSVERPPSTNDAYAHNPMSRNKESDKQRLSHADSLGVIEMTEGSSTEDNMTSLPAGWDVAYDTDGTIYYYHEETELTQWDPPVHDDSSSSVMQTPSAPELPARRGGK